MKKYTALVLVVLMLIFTACNNSNNSDNTTNNHVPKNTSTPQTDIHDPSVDNKQINTMEKLAEVEDVISVTKQSFSKQIKGAISYKVLYKSSNGKLSADVVLPSDYTNKNYTVLIYFPEVGINIDSLALNYANNDIIVIRSYARGFDESEGMRDLGGENDLEDAQKLLSIFNAATFIKNSKIFVAGSSEGSISALRLFAEDTEHRISGCAIVDVVADLRSFELARGENIQNLLSALIGKTYEEAPEEYDLRSAVKFSEKLDRPILMMHYLSNPFFPIEQTNSLYNLLSHNQDRTYYKIDAKTSDFNGEGLQRLLSWINKYD